MNFFDILLDEYKNDPFFNRSFFRNRYEPKGTDDYINYLKYINEYRKKEDEKINKILNKRRDDIVEKLAAIDNDIEKTEGELQTAKNAMETLDMDLQNIIDAVRGGYKHSRVEKMEKAVKLEGERKNDALACANVMYICMDKYNAWEKVVKRIKELERKLAALYRDKSDTNESLESIGFFLTEGEDGSPSEV